MNAAITQSTINEDRTIQIYPLENGKTFQIEFDKMPYWTGEPYVSYQMVATREQVEMFHKYLTQILKQTKPLTP